MTDIRDEIFEVVQRPRPRPTSLEDRLALIEAEAEIRDLVAAYGYLCDDRRWDQLVMLYTEDIERVLCGSLDEIVHGRDELKALLERPVLPRAGGSGSEAPSPEELEQLELRHLTCNVVVRVGPDRRTAAAVAYYQLGATRGDGDRLERGVHEGTYVFEFVRTDDGWRFSRQLIASNNATNPLFSRPAARA